MGRIVLTGLGILTPIGTGKKQFWDAVVKGFSGIKRITKFPSQYETRGGEISDINLDEYIHDRQLRRAAEISKYTMIAIDQSISDAGIKTFRGEDTALLVGITHGALNYTQEYHRSLITEGVDDISPILFSDSVLNAPAGNGSICFDINGPVHTLVGGATTGIKGIMLACQMLNSKRINKGIIVCAEELNELSLFCYSKLNNDTLSEGSGAILIENEDAMKGLYPYCYVSGIASRFNPSNLQEAFTETIERCLNMAGIVLKDIDLIMIDSTTEAIKEQCLNEIPAGCIIPLTGKAFSVTTIWHIILSALIIRYGVIPAAIIKDKAKIPDDIRQIMICSAEDQGAASAIILSKYS
jgi:3-oxoacyl-(acyl-carrier-protein) synthase